MLGWSKRDREKEKKREQKEGLTGWRIRQGKEQTFRGKREWDEAKLGRLKNSKRKRESLKWLARFNPRKSSGTIERERNLRKEQGEGQTKKQTRALKVKRWKKDRRRKKIESWGHEEAHSKMKKGFRRDNPSFFLFLSTVLLSHFTFF